MSFLKWLGNALAAPARTPVIPALSPEEDKDMVLVSSSEHCGAYCGVYMSRDAIYRIEEGNRKRRSLTVLPKPEWQIKRQGADLLVDGNWAFHLAAKRETACQFYVYSVKGHENLVKCGIAKDPVARKEKYYGRKLWTFQVPGGRREAELCEELFKHATYHLANVDAPKWNVGNMDEDNLRPEILELLESGITDGCSGFTEVRVMTKEQARTTFLEIWNDVHWTTDVASCIEKWGIHSGFSDGSRRRVHVPDGKMFWLKPHQEPEKHSQDYTGPHADLCREIAEERYQEDLLKYRADQQRSWDPQPFIDMTTFKNA